MDCRDKGEVCCLILLNHLVSTPWPVSVTAGPCSDSLQACLLADLDAAQISRAQPMQVCRPTCEMAAVLPAAGWRDGA